MKSNIMKKRLFSRSRFGCRKIRKLEPLTRNIWKRKYNKLTPEFADDGQIGGQVLEFKTGTLMSNQYNV